MDDGLESFSNWLATKASSKYPKLSKVAYTCTQFAVLEAAENIFHCGAGFTKLDFSGFTLKEILDIVKKIADDVEILLNAPQKETVLHFETTINMIKRGFNEKAYDKLKLVHEIGTRAIVYADRKSITFQIFKKALKVVHILISSNILFFSYDEDKKVFLPYSILPLNTRQMIGEEIEK